MYRNASALQEQKDSRTDSVHAQSAASGWGGVTADLIQAYCQQSLCHRLLPGFDLIHEESDTLSDCSAACSPAMQAFAGTVLTSAPPWWPRNLFHATFVLRFF
jgi:hypothetical protein